jgi:hypothetical protein
VTKFPLSFSPKCIKSPHLAQLTAADPADGNARIRAETQRIMSPLLPPNNADENDELSAGGAKSSALRSQNTVSETKNESDLQLLIDAWERLPQGVRDGILSVVKASFPR